MSYDLNILCVNQEQCVNQFPEDLNIYVEAQNKSKNEYPKYYDLYFHLMNSISGIWYYLEKDKECWSSFELCDICESGDVLYSERYPLKLKELYPFWYDSKEEPDVDFLCLKEKYKEDVLKVMQFLIESSPVHQIVFLPKYQIAENVEFIYGTIGFTKFVDLLEDKKILFNTCYVIKE